VRSPSAGDRGAVTAELAAAMPAVLLVLAVCLGALTALGQQAILADIAAQGARAEARGQPASTVLAGAPPGLRSIRLISVPRGDLVCVTASAAFAVPALSEALTITGEGCAVDGGW
jgi:hypothetical protein